MSGGLLLPITKLRDRWYTCSCPVVGIVLGRISRDLVLPQSFGCERALVVVSLLALNFYCVFSARNICLLLPVIGVSNAAEMRFRDLRVPLACLLGTALRGGPVATQ
jgi:hypothetical protein